jgi:hypothetical protein
MTQTQEILTCLNSGNSLTAIEALRRFGCFRLAARINDLRAAGHPIKTTMKHAHGKKFASYTLEATK